MTRITATTSSKFVILVIVYIAMAVVFSWLAVVQQADLSFDKVDCAAPAPCEAENIIPLLVDQLKQNARAYSNNVWTTLGTIIGAIGMVLGSRKFQIMLQANRLMVPLLQMTILLLFVLHALAYWFYQGENIRLMGLLGGVVASMEYYRGYLIGFETVVLNLVFDTVLFVLLAYIIDRMRNVTAAESGQ